MISQLVIETSRLHDDIFRAHITTPNSKLSQAAQAWETQFEEIAKRTGQYFTRKMQGSMIQEQKALVDKINQRINLLATNGFYTDYMESGKKQGKTGAATAGTSCLMLLVENEIRISVFQQLQMLFYFKVIYSLKKVLWSFHKKLRPVVVV